MAKNKERRKYIRVHEHHLIKYNVCERPQALSFVRNISTGGVLFHSDEDISVGTTLEMKINIPPSDVPVNVVVKVVHAEPLEAVGGVNVGAEFVHVEDKDRSLIEEAISDLSSGKGNG